MMVPLHIAENPKGAAQLKPAASLAPAIKLRDPEGALHELAEFRSRNVVLVFFQGAECSHCTKQLHELVREIRGIKGSGAEIVAVSSRRIADPARTLKSLGGSASDKIHLLVDEDHRAFRDFGCYKDGPLHGVFFIDPNGIIRFWYVGEIPFDDTRQLIERFKNLSALGAGTLFIR